LSHRAWRPRVRAVAESPEDSHLRSPPDPYVNLSVHTAPECLIYSVKPSRAPLVFRRNRLNLRRAQRNVVGYRKLDDSFKDFKTGPAISPISWFDAKQPRPREWGGEAHESNEMECCRRADDVSFSVRLPVRGSTPPDPGDRRDLSNTFRQLSSPNPTPIRRRLHLPWIGERNSDGNIGTLNRGWLADR